MKGAFCTNMSVTGPQLYEAWAKAKQFAGASVLPLALVLALLRAILICRLLLPRRSLPGMGIRPTGTERYGASKLDLLI